MNENMNVNMSQGESAIAAQRRGRLAIFGLTASALVLSALVLVQVGRSAWAQRLEPGAVAMGDMVNQGVAGEAALLTFDGGSSEDLLLVVDQRREQVLMYRVQNQRTLEFKGRESLRDLFTSARGGVRRNDQPAALPAAPMPPAGR